MCGPGTLSMVKNAAEIKMVEFVLNDLMQERKEAPSKLVVKSTRSVNLT